MMNYIQDYANFGLSGLTDFVLPFIAVLSVLVFVHEWGHYIIARRCGVKVDVFSIGFGKELFGFTDKSGTRWKFSLIPLGGYVQMFGNLDPAGAKDTSEIEIDGVKRPMTDEEKEVAVNFKSVGQRAAIVFAGPAINFLFAIILLTGLYATVGKPVTPPIAAAVIVGGAGANAGIQPHDRILSIDGQSIESFADIQRQVAISLDRPLKLTVDRNGDVVDLTVSPQLQELEDRFGFKSTRGLIGIMAMSDAIDAKNIMAVNGVSLVGKTDVQRQKMINDVLGENTTITLPGGENGRDVLVHLVKLQDEKLFLTQNIDKEMIRYGIFNSVFAAIDETGFIVKGTLEAIGQIITGTRSATELGGIVRIGAIAGDAAQSGWIALITFTALLSINLGLINLFPIPLLDGGHLVFYAYEAVFGKPISEKVMDYALRFGMVFLVGLMLFANLNDIVQIAL